jgi:hypothetical protein
LFLLFDIPMTTEEERLKELDRIRHRRSRDKKKAKKEERNRKDRERRARKQQERILLSIMSASRGDENLNNSNQNGAFNLPPNAQLAVALFQEARKSNAEQAQNIRLTTESNNRTMLEQFRITQQQQQQALAAQEEHAIRSLNQAYAFAEVFSPGSMRNIGQVLSQLNNIPQRRLDVDFGVDASSSAAASAASPSVHGIFSNEAAAVAQRNARDAYTFIREQGGNMALAASSSTKRTKEEAHDDASQDDITMGLTNRRILKAKVPNKQGVASLPQARPVDTMKPTDGTGEYAQSNKKPRPVVDTTAAASPFGTSGGFSFGSAPTASSARPSFNPFAPSNDGPFSLGQNYGETRRGHGINNRRINNNKNYCRTPITQHEQVGTPIAHSLFGSSTPSAQKQVGPSLFGNPLATPQQDPGQQNNSTTTPCNNQPIDDDDDL